MRPGRRISDLCAIRSIPPPLRACSPCRFPVRWRNSSARRSRNAQGNVKAAKAQGKRPGNSGVRERQPEAIRKIALAPENVYRDELIASADQWMPTVRRLRPQHPWEDVVRVLGDRGQSWTVVRLWRAVGKLVAPPMVPPALLSPAPRKSPGDRLMMLVVGVAMADPVLSLRDIGAQLERMGEWTPRGGLKWPTSSGGEATRPRERSAWHRQGPCRAGPNP